MVWVDQAQTGNLTAAQSSPGLCPGENSQSMMSHLWLAQVPLDSFPRFFSVFYPHLVPFYYDCCLSFLVELQNVSLRPSTIIWPNTKQNKISNLLLLLRTNSITPVCYHANRDSVFLLTFTKHQLHYLLLYPTLIANSSKREGLVIENPVRP